MPAAGWKQLIPSTPCFQGEDSFPIAAYSEFMPPPWVGYKPYGHSPPDDTIVREDDPYGWHINEYEEHREMEPGMLLLARQILKKLSRLFDGDPETGIPRVDLTDNPYWTEELAEEKPRPHERCVILMPLALSRTQDDKGRVAWTVFGNSEQGPGKAFWKSFYTAPGKEAPEEEGIGFLCRLLNEVYGLEAEDARDLRRAGFRILPDQDPLCDFWEEELPSWTEQFLLGERASAARIKYLLTFRSFGKLPKGIRHAFLDDKIRLLPFPGSLIFWGQQSYHRLQEQLPFALQIPLVIPIPRSRGPNGLRVPQDGFFHEPTAAQPHPRRVVGPIRNTFKRTHRWDRVHRDQDELALIDREDKLLHVLFSTNPDDMGLYDKPMARNVQIWTDEGELLLDGPRASRTEIKEALHTVQQGGLFGYRFLYPAMRIGRYEVYWHRPLCAYLTADNEAKLIDDAPTGYLTAYVADRPQLDKPVELWPRFDRRPIPLASLPFYHIAGKGPTTARNIRKLHDTRDLIGMRLPRTMARQLLTLAKDDNLETWLSEIPSEDLRHELSGLIEPTETPLPMPPTKRGPHTPLSLTYERTSKRNFEVAYWKTIVALSEGELLNKNTGDPVADDVTQAMLTYHERQLEAMGDYLLAYYHKQIEAAGMTGQVLAGSLPFQWRTDFDYSWMGGWVKNQESPAERNLLVMIPGRDRSRAVIMSDHYDTAYMYDKYEKTYGGRGARIAACGADDNHSATAALMLGAPIFLEMSKAGQLECDIWIIHLTGEEFPSDCLGARALSQRLVEGTLAVHLPGGEVRDLSGVRIEGMYISDMIAHNNDRDRDVFQITPGTGKASMWLAYQAHIATEIWNASALVWNQRAERAGRPPGRRSPHGGAIPEIAPHMILSGEIRPVTDPRSTLYNTDAQILSDAGVPVVLFMENYDISRVGYHDTHDRMANIDLDYGSAFAAIVIETIARAATEEPWA
jgi:hypothetical protein